MDLVHLGGNEEANLLPKPSFGKVETVVKDRIRVRWNSTTWDTYFYISQSYKDFIIEPGQTVTVIGIRGIRLIALF